MKLFFQEMIQQKKRAAGICVPLFSLRTNKTGGVGDFQSLKLLIDWCKEVGLKLIQLLPINDTTVFGNWKDSYPYSAVSAFALHPIYFNNEEEKLEDLNQETLEYDQVYHYKLRSLEKLFLAKGKNVLSSEEFNDFYNANQEWLGPYSTFCALRDYYQTSDTSKWQTDNLEIEQERVSFYRFVQFILHQQLKDVVNYAQSKGVLLKGDFPVGVNRHSIDTWVQPKLFYLDRSLGAPPDYFNQKGQNWGFPSYKWEVHQATHYEWFCKRLQHLSKYFQVMRIDHILGYFRFWEIPEGAIHGLRGSFNPCLTIKKEELAALKVPIQQLLEPKVNPKLLQDFHQNLETIQKHLSSISTEKEIEEQIKDNKIKELLFAILNDVILLEDQEKKGEYHFRFNMHDTYTFSQLDIQDQELLKNLYHDYFFVRQDQLWKEEALKKLPAFLKASDMLICAEDLGFVPACVKEVLNELGILELYIQRMPKKSGQEFGLPWEYPYLSVCSPSNHDTSVLRAWWQENREQTLRYCKTVLNLENPPLECTSEIIQKIMQQHLNSKSMWAIFMLQDVVGLESNKFCYEDPKKERINDPMNSNHYWNFRYPFFLEELLKDKPLQNLLSKMNNEANRA